MASKTRSANCFWPRGLSLSFPTSTEGEHQQQDATDLQAEEEAEPRPDQRTETARLGPPRHLKLHTPALLAACLLLLVTTECSMSFMRQVS